MERCRRHNHHVIQRVEIGCRKAPGRAARATGAADVVVRSIFVVRFVPGYHCQVDQRVCTAKIRRRVARHVVRLMLDMPRQHVPVGHDLRWREEIIHLHGNFDGLSSANSRRGVLLMPILRSSRPLKQHLKMNRLYWSWPLNSRRNPAASPFFRCIIV